MSAAWDAIHHATVMVETGRNDRKRGKIIMAVFAVIAGVVTAQQLVIEDGTSLVIELERPQAVHAVLRKDRDVIFVKSLHANEAEAIARMEAEEALAERSESGSSMQ